LKFLNDDKLIIYSQAGYIGSILEHG